MSAITNFHPIKAINSLLQPFGLTLSNKQQIINKAALAALAILVVTCGLGMVEAQSSTIRDAGRAQSSTDCYETCGYIRIPSCTYVRKYYSRADYNACLADQSEIRALLTRCNNFCKRKWGE